jgi:ornithine carbamoyltransferase
VKDLLRIDDLTGDDVTLLLRLAADFQDAPESAHDLLAHRIVPMYFAKPSTRTRLSTAAAPGSGGRPSPSGPTSSSCAAARPSATRPG